jgi:hypothetical protein
MKKLLTLALMASAVLFAGQAMAQRSIDWSVDEIVSPTELNSTPQGTSFTIDLALKNNGTDTAEVGDTVLYQIIVATTSNQYIMGYPGGTTNFALRILDKQILPGDTMHVTQSLTSSLLANFSLNVNFIATSWLWNRGSVNPITAETAPGNANNIKSEQIVWFNQQGWAVSTDEVSENNVHVSPNPVADQLNLKLDVIDTESDLTVDIVDITGKVVYTENLTEGFREYTVNTSDLTNGVYFVRITNGDQISSAKIVVSK